MGVGVVSVGVGGEEEEGRKKRRRRRRKVILDRVWVMDDWCWFAGATVFRLNRRRARCSSSSSSFLIERISDGRVASTGMYNLVAYSGW